eukprot:TRINITY_DN525_c8_g1_i1.p1 TRINITY_DN525_c8_g1~~TRINITY_DN525_c8_g1_i1.p1  ORF type:complete len:454 (+),score=90.57 TRINITY_DN525_c8_g1_i1:80-1441(+)
MEILPENEQRSEKKIWQGHSYHDFELFLRSTIWPLFSFFWCPATIMFLIHCHKELDGSLLNFYEITKSEGMIYSFWSLWTPVLFGSKEGWMIVFSHIVIQIILMVIIPGKRWEGPPTQSGHIPVYRANGFQTFVTTLVLFFLGNYYKVIRYGIVYDNIESIIGCCNVISLAFCVFLYFKGKYYPSKGEHSVSNNKIWSFYWGVELYPRILGLDIKHFTNCRFGMMGWALLILSYALKQIELFGFVKTGMIVACGLQMIYIAKFFWWETGYLRSLDIMHDRAGYYIVWGVMVWLPGTYTASTLYLVQVEQDLNIYIASFIFIVGCYLIYINYEADEQRWIVRNKTDAKIWGKKPKLIHTEYVTEQGETKKTILLASGWWGVSRHFHYIPEILASLFWILPSGFNHFLPYFYVVYLTILLLERGLRDDKRCKEKYGKDWDKYCELVPYRFIPYIF